MHDLYNCTKFRKCAGTKSAVNFMLILGLQNGETEKSWPILQEIFYDNNIKLKIIAESVQNKALRPMNMHSITACK